MLYKNVQGLRAIAASIVVLGHSGFLMASPGVDIFFVISGFIVCQVAARPHTGALPFLARRCWRIFPIYWIVLAFSVLINALGIDTGSWIPSHHPALDYILLLKTDNRFLPPVSYTHL